MDVAEGHLEINLGFFPLFWAFYFLRPSISINGTVEKTRWGTQIRKLAAGPYDLIVWFPWILVPEAGRAELTVNVVQDKVTAVRYRPRWLAIAGGRMKVVAPRIAAPPMRSLP
jgi:hypothetical protein